MGIVVDTTMKYYGIPDHHIGAIRTARMYITKYPKFLLFFITIMLSFLLFNSRSKIPFTDAILSLSYLGTFLVGIFFAYSYTAAPATVMFLILAKEQNILLAGFVGGLGALVGDLIIFSFVTLSFKDEIEKLSHERVIEYINHRFPQKIKRYLIPIFASFIIASPMPDEFGVALLAVSEHISMKLFSILSYVLNTIGIIGVLYIGKII
jgi:hypothetical protein